MRTANVAFIFLILIVEKSSCNKKFFTPLDIDNHPCTAENLKVQIQPKQTVRCVTYVVCTERVFI